LLLKTLSLDLKSAFPSLNCYENRFKKVEADCDNHSTDNNSVIVIHIV